MGHLSHERLSLFEERSWRYFDWLTVLNDAGIKNIQDLNGQYLLACPFHEDQSPSFRIRVKEHNYHCFSCNAFGSIVDLMWKLSGRSLSRAAFFDQILKSNPAMQVELGFKSLFIDAGTLDPALMGRRRFDPSSAIGMQMPMSVLSSKVRNISDSWEALVLSLTLLQEGEIPDNVYSRCKSILSGHPSAQSNVPADEKVSLLSLLELEY